MRRPALILITLFLVISLSYWSLDLIEDPLGKNAETFEPSLIVQDRQGRILWEFLSSNETRSEWKSLKTLNQSIVQAAIAAEDKRFYSHIGVDPLAVARAAFANIKHGRIVSGASTITMQLARSLKPGPRTLSQKIKEAVLALKIEKEHTKDEIIEEYLNRIPFGNLTCGVCAASKLYFDKSPRYLTPAESALLMAIPQAPSLYNPFRSTKTAVKKRNSVLERMAELGFINEEQKERAMSEPLALNSLNKRFNAPHFVNYIKSNYSDGETGIIRTTLDLQLQREVEKLTSETVKKSKQLGIKQAAVLVMDHKTREILAWVGSADFYDPEGGQNDGATSLRQPGSTVKPFTYAAAFDSGYSPASIISDSPVEFGLSRGVYEPSNYDNRFRGDVSLRTALASSLNVPAVKLLHKVGLQVVYGKMKQAGLASLDRDPDYYGLGLTLGAGEVTLLELANAYATIASGGVYKPPVVVFKENDGLKEEKRVFTPQSAYMVAHILSDDHARAAGFGRNSLLDLPFPAAAKTGTSKNFRDNWTVGFTSSYVVAVWAGNFDARPMGRVSGISGAGPLWRKVMRLAASYYPTTEFKRPEGLTTIDICTQTGLRAAPGCPHTKKELFQDENLPSGYCLLHNSDENQTGAQVSMRVNPRLSAEKDVKVKILNPQSGERYLYDPGIDPEYQKLLLQAVAPGHIDAVKWFVNDVELTNQGENVSLESGSFWPLERGEAVIKAVGYKNGKPAESDQVTITVY